ncbi:MAG: flagellin [Comamonas sp.]|uniref:flagellin N-terminal helical domain-containing protein n=1 Tax=Comamonas sp. TaxID=34028 RepID=UPI00264764A5|nr:flagellin [Comamonas sp.]MDN5503841.1 flagellin [Comamonas sp.]MDN5536141.1 flagellin [Comamonas sp.]
MAMTINTNIQSLNAQRNLGTSQSSLSTSMQRLSSGMRINSAKDDAAGLAIATRMGTQITGLNQAQRNANDGVSLAQTAEGALSTIGGNLQRIRELAVQSRNATNSTEDRAALQKEVVQLKSEIDRVATTTSFNGTNLLDGSFTSKAFQVGANQGELINIDSIQNASVKSLGSWNSVAINASVAGAAPDGGYVAPTATTTAASGAFTTVTGAAAGDSYKLTVGGVTIIDKQLGVGGSVAAADIDNALSNQTTKDALKAAGLTVSGSAGTNNLAFQKADGNDIAVTQTTVGATGFAAAFVTTANNGTAATPASYAALTGAALTIQGTNATAINIEVPAAATGAERSDKLAAAINAQSDKTGVTASVNNGALSLSSTKGDFTIGTNMTGATAAADFKAATGLTAGISGGAAGGVGFVKGSTQNGFASLDISDVQGADNAILAMDAALKSVNSARADLGAMQNRFESVVSNLSVNSENLSASKSRIMDADFASETANLSRSQILQQAGTAMVAQANQLPQGVLSLLR